MPDEIKKPDQQVPLKFRFGLRHLFYATALVATGLALGPGTIFPTVLVLAVWPVVFMQKNRLSALGWAVIALLFIFCLSGLLLPAVAQVRAIGRDRLLFDTLPEVQDIMQK